MPANAPSHVTAGQYYRKATTEAVGVAVSFVGKLREGELLTGTPTVSGSGLTLSSASVNTGPIQVLGETCPAGTAVTFTVSGGSADTDYNILVSCGTTSSQTRVLYCPLRVQNS